MIKSSGEEVASLTREVLQLHSQVRLTWSCFRQFLGVQERSTSNALQARVLIEAFQQIGASKRSAEPDHPPSTQRLQNVIPGLETAKAILQVFLHTSTSKPTIDDVWATLQGVPGLRPNNARRIFVQLALLQMYENGSNPTPEAFAGRVLSALVDNSDLIQ